MPNKETAYFDLPVKYTDADLGGMGLELAELLTNKLKIEKLKKDSSDNFKGQIAEIEEDIYALQNKIGDGTYLTEVQCEVIKDDDENIIEVIRIDNGEIVEKYGNPKLNLSSGENDGETESETDA